MRAFHTGYRFWGVRFSPLATHYYHPLLSTDEAHTTHLPCRASTWVGSTAPPSCPMHHHSFTDDTFGDFRRHGPYSDTIDSFSAPKPLSGLFRPTRLPPIRKPAPEKAPWTLELLQDRLSGRYSFSPSPTISASVLALPSPSSGLFLPRDAIAPPSPLETLGSPPTPASSPPPAPTNFACPFKPPSTTLGLLPRLFQPLRRRLRSGLSSMNRHGHRRRL